MIKYLLLAAAFIEILFDYRYRTKDVKRYLCRDSRVLLGNYLMVT